MAGPELTTFWSSPKCPFAIRTSNGLLEQINLAVTDSFLAFRRGGIEIGGLLFGKRTGNQLELLAHRPIFCEHAQGPGFVLSPADHSRLSRQMGDWQLDPLLAGMRVVGWYRSRTRGPLMPAADDVTFHSQYFPDAFQFLLVLKPDLGLPTRATVFFASVDGVLDPDPDFAEVELAQAVIAREEAPAREPVGQHPLADLPSVRETAPRHPARRPHSALAWTLFFAVAAAMLGGALWRPPNQGLGLRLAGGPSKLRIEWNRASPAFEDIRGGVIEIREGDDLTTASFEPFELRQSSVYYFPRSGRVDVRLRVDSAAGRRIEERASFGVTSAPLP